VEVTKATTEVRCQGGRLHFMVNEQGLVEVRCRHCAARVSKELGYRVVVFHYFDIQRGKRVATKTYPVADDRLNTSKTKGGEKNGS